MIGTGLLQIFEHVPLALVTVKITCVLYLLYLAWKIATSTPRFPDQPEKSPQSRPLTLFEAALFQWINPKVWSMQLSAISLYAPNPPSLPDILLVAGVFAVLVYPVNIWWIVLGQKLRPLLDQPQKVRMFNLLSAILLLCSLYPVLHTVS